MSIINFRVLFIINGVKKLQYTSWDLNPETWLGVLLNTKPPELGEELWQVLSYSVYILGLQMSQCPSWCILFSLSHFCHTWNKSILIFYCSCLALRDLMVVYPSSKLFKYLSQLWELCLRARDDIKVCTIKPLVIN